MHQICKNWLGLRLFYQKKNLALSSSNVEQGAIRPEFGHAELLFHALKKTLSRAYVGYQLSQRANQLHQLLDLSYR
jgi:hypothetical protein